MIESSATEPETLRVLTVMPEEPWADDLRRALGRAGFETRGVLTIDSALLASSHFRPVALFLDAACLQAGAYRVMERFRIALPTVPILVFAEEGQEDLRLRALLMGAEDCLVRPFAPQEAVIRLRRAVENRLGLTRLAADNQDLREQGRRSQRETYQHRTRLLRQVSMLQRSVDFLQRLDPHEGSGRLLDKALRNLSLQIGVPRVAYLTRSRVDGSWMTTQASYGVPDSLAQRLRLPVGGELVSLLESSAAPAILDQLCTVPGLRVEMGILASGGFTAVVPLLHRARLHGAVVLGEAREGGAPDRETLQMAQFLAAPILPALIAQEAQEAEREVSRRSLITLVSHLETRIPFLTGHSQRVARLAMDLGSRAGLDEPSRTDLFIAGVLHDVGRFDGDPSPWLKEGPLDGSEWERVRRHPAEGERIAAEASWPEPVLEGIRSHHERWDGGGYPLGLRGEAIPLSGRILAVVDCFEALTSARPHRDCLSPEAAMTVLRGESGRSLDPHLVGLFLAGSELLQQS